jgi:lipoprotein-anchoring transpeptidase ErfK/SrfK
VNKRWITIIVTVVAIVLVAVIAVKVKKGMSFGSSSAPAPESVQKLLDQAQQSLAQEDQLKAKEAYQQIISDHPDYDKIEEIQNKLSELNIAIIFSKLQTPETETYEVQPGDSLGKLSKKYNTTKELIKRSNSLKSDVIRIGEKLRIWKAPFSVLVNKSQNILTLKSGEEFVKIYHVATGRDRKDNMTPVGVFKIASKIPNPVWFKPGGQPVPPESPENELGSRWMGFDTNPHYGIHGTIHPDAIGTNATAGCVRLANPDVEELFDLLPVGTTVTIQE